MCAEYKDLYRKHGYEYQAQEIERAEAALQKQKIEAEIEAMEKRNLERQKVNEARANMSLVEKIALESQGQTIDQVIKKPNEVPRKSCLNDFSEKYLN